mmetsp:Transcript_1213/g.4360  ORF Transcript_1213/g.4360 Transcript_1213/m.4360 type:complete len:214 (+) Transcript_1213:261-902(+)
MPPHMRDEEELARSEATLQPLRPRAVRRVGVVVLHEPLEDRNGRSDVGVVFARNHAWWSQLWRIHHPLFQPGGQPVPGARVVRVLVESGAGPRRADQEPPVGRSKARTATVTAVNRSTRYGVALGVNRALLPVKKREVVSRKVRGNLVVGRELLHLLDEEVVEEIHWDLLLRLLRVAEVVLQPHGHPAALQLRLAVPSDERRLLPVPVGERRP